MRKLVRALKPNRRPFRSRPFDEEADEEYGMLDEWMVACPGK
jgi:hypothetical protein